MKTTGCRDAFVAMIKEENFYSSAKQSLKQHHRGQSSGFANEMVQKRWYDFKKGWDAAEDNRPRKIGAFMVPDEEPSAF